MNILAMHRPVNIKVLQQLSYGLLKFTVVTGREFREKNCVRTVVSTI